MLDLNHVSMTFNPGTVNEKKALTDINLHMESGEFATIVGSNGAGKSTLFNAIAGSFIPDTGSILLDGVDMTFQPDFRRSKAIGRLFQDPLKGTAPNMTIEENLALAYLRASTHTSPFSRITKADRELFTDRLVQLGLGLENRMKQPVGLLSGGQRQALTLLMATLVTPKLLLLDEHTAALDPATADKVLELTKKIGGRKPHHLPDDYPQHARRPGIGQPHADDGFRPHCAGYQRGRTRQHHGGRPAGSVRQKCGPPGWIMTASC